MLAHSSRRFSLADRKAKNDMRTSVLVLFISTRMLAAPARSVTSVSRSRHSSSTVVLSVSRYAFFLSLVFRACSRFRSRFAFARSAGVILLVSMSMSALASSVDPDDFLVVRDEVDVTDDPEIFMDNSQSVSLADTTGALVVDGLALVRLAACVEDAGGGFKSALVPVPAVPAVAVSEEPDGVRRARLAAGPVYMGGIPAEADIGRLGRAWALFGRCCCC
mmetsp:Transcript_44554/g.107951  ORF Transcript_44554/g.107951 Transcript_44554/m.107951 type:complete len:220 (-) Transcript_44554:1323-1982(-)